MNLNVYAQYLKDLKAKRVKIIVGEFDEERACEVMCQAYRLNMTAKEGYVWFLPNFNSEFLQVCRETNLPKFAQIENKNVIPILEFHAPLVRYRQPHQSIQSHSGSHSLFN